MDGIDYDQEIMKHSPSWIEDDEAEEGEDEESNSSLVMKYIRMVTGKVSGQKFSRCMMCGRPFNFTIQGDVYSDDGIVRKTRVVRRGTKGSPPKLNHNKYKGFYLCDECTHDMKANPNRKFISHTCYNEKGHLIKKPRYISFSDLTKEDKKKLLETYKLPHKEVLEGTTL